MTVREAIARWLAPEMAKDADRWWRVQSDMQELKRWLGHDFPMIEVTLDRLTIGSFNYTRALDEKPLIHKYPNFGVWPNEIYSFREKLKATFGSHVYTPVRQPSYEIHPVVSALRDKHA